MIWALLPEIKPMMMIGIPASPTLTVQSAGDRWVLISWTTGDDRYAPVRNFTLQKRLMPPRRRSYYEYVSAADYLPSTLRNFTVTGSVVSRYVIKASGYKTGFETVIDDLIDELPVEKRHLSKLIIICRI